ncbi:hypothetical protein Bbelb_440610 [Branchiostoma belcheri]|nr:hypothetical protein Bbelb_444970 [Branchiostoma belcheri]KAI8478203.1 hypothetical protein Bbelb_440610 [Branchiostoma belcheri]
MAKPPQIPPARRAAERALPGRAPEPAPADELCSPHKIGFIAPCQLKSSNLRSQSAHRRDVMSSPRRVIAPYPREGQVQMPSGENQIAIHRSVRRIILLHFTLLDCAHTIFSYRNSFEVEDIRVDITWGNIRGPVRVVYRTAAVVSDPQPTTNVFLLLDD